MNRRESLKAIGLTTLSTAVLLEACKTDKNKTADIEIDETGREPHEVERDRKLLAEENFFTDHEMATISVLADIIIPRDEFSGSATDAKVPDFIAFIVRDMPDHQVPMRGGLKWLDLHSLKIYGKTFTGISEKQQLEIVDAIAYPNIAKPGMEQGVAFFNRMRGLTASGFYTSKIGIKDIGYVGNVPNQWDGVPADVLKQYRLENVKI